MPIALICFSALDIQAFYIQAEIMREFTLVPVEKRCNKNRKLSYFSKSPSPFFLLKAKTKTRFALHL